MSPKDLVSTDADSDHDGVKEDYYQRRRGKEDVDVENLPHEDENNDQPTISLCRQLAVCAGLLASDGGLVFMQLTMLPCLQTLGVPVSMVTIPGCLSGSLALVGLNVLGKISDGGDHPHRRKKPAVVMSTLLFATGLSLVASGCALHMWGTRSLQADTADPTFPTLNFGPSLDEMTPSGLPWGASAASEPSRLPPQHTSGTPFDGTVPSGLSWGASAADPKPFHLLPRYASRTDTDVITYMMTTSQDEAEVRLSTVDGWIADPLGLGIPLSGLLSMLGFVFLDMGNDFTNSSLKSFVFASTAKEQHVSLLVVGVVMSAAGGCVAAVLGLIGVGALLTDGTGLEAVPANTLLQSAFFVILLFICTSVTIFSAPPIRLHAAMGKKTSSNRSMPPSQSSYGTMQKEPDKSNIIRVTSLSDVSSDSSDFGHAGHNEAKRTFQHLIDENSRSSSQNTDLRTSVGLSQLTDDETSRSLTPSYSENKAHSLKAKDNPENRPLHGSEEKRFSLLSLKMTKNKKRNPFNSIEYSELHEDDDVSSQRNCRSTSDSSKICRQESSSESTAHAEYCDIDNSSGRRCCRCLTRTSRKLVLICTSMFFMAGAWQSFNTCMTDYLGKVLYGGDPEADAGSQSYTAYQQGMRTGSFGILLLNVAYVIFNLLQRALLAVVGPKTEQLVICAAQIGLLMTLQFTDNVIAFFITAIVIGIFRSAMYTIPFMLANEICQEEAQSLTGKGSAKVGSTMALVTSMLPLSYVLVSSLTGPLIQATGDPSSPLYYAAACTLTAAFVFAFT